MNDAHSFGRVGGRETLENGTGRSQSVAFNVWDELESLRATDAWQHGSSRKTLVRYPDFRVDLVAMKRGTAMPRHSAAGRISVQCISGVVRMQTPAGRFDLPPGEVVVLDHGVWHDVEAQEDSAFLLTLALPRAEVPALLNAGRWVLPNVFEYTAPAGA